MEPLGPFDPYAPFEPLESVGASMHGATGASSTAHELQALAETRAQHLADLQIQEEEQLPQAESSAQVELTKTADLIETVPLQASVHIDTVSNLSRLTPELEPLASGTKDEAGNDFNEGTVPLANSAVKGNNFKVDESNNSTVAVPASMKSSARSENPLMSELSKVLSSRRLSATIYEEATVKLGVSIGAEPNSNSTAICQDGHLVEQTHLLAESAVSTADSMMYNNTSNVNTAVREGESEPKKELSVSSDPTWTVKEVVPTSSSVRNDDASPAGGLMAQIRAQAQARDRRQSATEEMLSATAAAESDAALVIAPAMPQETKQNRVGELENSVSAKSAEDSYARPSTEAGITPLPGADTPLVANNVESQRKGSGTTGKRKGCGKKKKR